MSNGKAAAQVPFSKVIRYPVLVLGHMYQYIPVFFHISSSQLYSQIPADFKSRIRTI